LAWICDHTPATASIGRLRGNPGAERNAADDAGTLAVLPVKAAKGPCMGYALPICVWVAVSYDIGIFPAVFLGILYYHADFRGNVESKRIEFTPETTGPFTNSVDAYWETRGIVKGYIYDIIGDVIKISYDMPSGLGEDQVEQRWTQRTAPVLIYDKADENNPISVGSFADAKTYYNLKENCSKVVLSANAGEPVMYVIYK